MSEKKDFFVSYTDNDEQRAEWIAGILEKAGYSTIIQAWDFRAGESFVNNMHKALINCDRFIAVLSEEYLESLYCQTEWQAAFTKAPGSEKGLFIITKIDNVKPEGLLAPIIYVDLHGIDEAEAERRLLDEVSTEGRPRNKLGFPETTTICNNIIEASYNMGLIHDHLCDDPKSLEWYEKALSFREKTRIPKHPSTETSSEKPHLIAREREFIVWFGTNRIPIIKEKNLIGFGSKRSNGETYYGNCSVHIPKSHTIGEINPNIFKRIWNWDWESMEIKGTPKILDTASFWQEIANSLGQREKDDSLLFLHGYNVTFEQAAIQAAQLGYDLGIPGITSFFSWPSLGTISGYAADTESLELSEDIIRDFLEQLCEHIGTGRLHIIAHSMGNRGLLRIFQHISDRCKIGQIILAAPDVDQAIFTKQVVRLLDFSKRVTLYASNKDIAIKTSEFLRASYPRAGCFPPAMDIMEIDKIFVPKFNIFDLWHSYFSSARSMLEDINDLLLHNHSPEDRRIRLKHLLPEGYWEMM